MKLGYAEYLALCDVVDYLHDDELKHYEECSEGFRPTRGDCERGNDDSKQHIWHSVKMLLNAIKYAKKEYEGKLMEDLTDG